MVHESYRNGMTATDHHVQHSIVTKSLTTMSRTSDRCREDGQVDAPFDRYVPEWRNVAGWRGVTLSTCSTCARACNT